MNEMLWVVGQLVVGCVCLVGGGEMLVRGASALAVAMRVSPLVIGLTVVAFGTSAPELGVSLRAALVDEADVAIGNVVGSNILNVLCILGVSAVIAPLLIARQLLRVDVPLMILVSFLLWGICLDGRIGRWEGALLFGGIVAYVLVCIVNGRRGARVPADELVESLPPAPHGTWGVIGNLLLIVVGLALLVLGSKALVAGAVTVAAYLGVSELVIGLTIVALGTSLPELVTSVVAAIRGERDIAVGNIVGSNIFKILCVLGMSAMLASDGILVSKPALIFDIPVMVAVAVLCLPIFYTGRGIARWEGALFLLYYAIYTVVLILAETDVTLSRNLTWLATISVVPLSILAILASVVATFRRDRVQSPSASDAG